jgi:hypothetical protein
MHATLAILCCGTAFLVAGCGGGSSSSQQLSPTAFRTQANQICGDLRTDEKPDLGSTTKEAVDRNLTRIDDALTKLDALNPPASDEQQFRDLLTRFRRSVAFVRANEAHLIQLTHQLQKNPSDTNAAAAYQRLVSHFASDVRTAGADAKKLGLGVCAKGFLG